MLQVITHQFDYALLVESFLYFSWPALGAAVKKYILPVNGAALAYIGRQIHQHGSRKVRMHSVLVRVALEAQKRHGSWCARRESQIGGG